MLEETVLAGPGGFAAGAVFALVAPDVLRRRARLFRQFVAVAAAGGAVLAGSRPTGATIPDLLLPAVLAAVVTLLSARTRPWTIAIVGVAVAMASVGSPGAVFGFSAAGIGLATALTARKAPVATVVVGALAVNALLRLRIPGPHGLESILAAVLLAAISWLGYRRLGRPDRGRVDRAVLVVGGVFVVLGLLGAVAVATARPGLETGTRAAGRGLSAAKAADEAAAAADLDAAEVAFSSARATLSAFWARPAEVVPIVSQHVRALRRAASSGEELAAAGGRVADAADLGGIRIQDGRIPLEPIQALASPLADARDGVTRALKDLRRVQSPWLVGPVGERLDDNLERLADSEASLRTSAELIEVLPDLLGAKGERRWFLAVQTPSEARATGGFIGNYGEITATAGELDLPRFGRIGELNAGGDQEAKRLVGPADYVARYDRFAVARTWQNVTLSPDFPSVAEVIGGLYPQSGGTPVQGAIAIDPAGIAAFLRLTGPLSVPQWPEPLTAENAERILLYDQYVEFGENTDRIDFLGEAARRLWQQVTSGSLPPPQEIVKVLGPAVQGKHLIISSLDDREDAALGRAGVNGRMAPVDGDALAVVTQNATGNKIEWFLQREVEYRPKVDRATGALTATLRLVLRNTAPSGGLPDYIIGTVLKPPLPTGTNRLYLSVYTPHRVVSARIAGQPTAFEPETELGRRVYSSFVDIPPQSSVVVEFDLAGQLPANEDYTLDVHAQPLVTPDAFRLIADVGPTPFERTVTLFQNARLRLRP